jgi:hypothetical protein
MIFGICVFLSTCELLYGIEVSIISKQLNPDAVEQK